MGFDIADDHIHALVAALVGGFEHGIGLAHAGGITEEDLELAARLAGLLLRLHAGQQLVGVGAESVLQTGILCGD